MPKETREIPARACGWFATDNTAIIIVLFVIYLRLSPSLTCFLFPIACHRVLCIWYPGPVCIAPPFQNLLDPGDRCPKACRLHDWFLPKLVFGFELSWWDPDLGAKLTKRKKENKFEVAASTRGHQHHKQHQQHSSTTSCLVGIRCRSWIRRLLVDSRNRLKNALSVLKSTRTMHRVRNTLRSPV